MAVEPPAAVRYLLGLVVMVALVVRRRCQKLKGRNYHPGGLCLASGTLMSSVRPRFVNVLPGQAQLDGSEYQDRPAIVPTAALQSASMSSATAAALSWTSRAERAMAWRDPGSLQIAATMSRR